MGNAESALDDCMQSFKYPVVGNFNFNQCEVYLIEDDYKAEAAVAVISRCKRIFVDCEGDCFGSINSEVGTVQIAVSAIECFIFHLKRNRRDLRHRLKEILELKRIAKVFHDCSGDIAALRNEGIDVEGQIDDTQEIQKFLDCRITEITEVYSLKRLYEHLFHSSFPETRKTPSGCANRWTDCEELTENMIKYAALDALLLAKIYKQQIRNGFRKSKKYRERIQRKLMSKLQEYNCRSNESIDEVSCCTIM